MLISTGHIRGIEDFNKSDSSLGEYPSTLCLTHARHHARLIGLDIRFGIIRLEKSIGDEGTLNVRDGDVADFKGLGVVPYLPKSTC